MANKQMQMYRVTIRATDEAVPPVLLKYMIEMLSQGDDEDRGGEPEYDE